MTYRSVSWPSINREQSRQGVQLAAPDALHRPGGRFSPGRLQVRSRSFHHLSGFESGGVPATVRAHPGECLARRTAKASGTAQESEDLDDVSLSAAFFPRSVVLSLSNRKRAAWARREHQKP
jgi:hypothetical protein